MTDQPSLTDEERATLAALDAMLRAELPLEESGYRLCAPPLHEHMRNAGADPGWSVSMTPEGPQVFLRIEELTGETTPTLDELVLMLGPRQREWLAEAPTRMRAVLRVVQAALACRRRLLAGGGQVATPILEIGWALRTVEPKLAGKKRTAEAWESALRKYRKVARILAPSPPATRT